MPHITHSRLLLALFLVPAFLLGGCGATTHTETIEQPTATAETVEPAPMTVRETDPAFRTAPAEDLNEMADDVCWAYSVVPPEPSSSASNLGPRNAWSHQWGPFVAETMEAHATGLDGYSDYAELGEAVTDWKCPEYGWLTWAIAYTHRDR